MKCNSTIHDISYVGQLKRMVQKTAKAGRIFQWLIGSLHSILIEHSFNFLTEDLFHRSYLAEYT